MPTSEETLGKMGTDETGASGDEDSHERSLDGHSLTTDSGFALAEVPGAPTNPDTKRRHHGRKPTPAPPDAIGDSDRLII
jgi:hypothetical protein